MKDFPALCGTLLVALFTVAAPGGAAPAFDCSGAERASFETVCADAELVRLDRALDAAVARRVAAVDS